MKRYLKIGLHLAVIHERRIKFSFSNAKLLLDEVILNIDNILKKAVGEKRNVFFFGLLLEKGEMPIKVKLNLYSFLEEVIKNLHFPLLTKGKQNRKTNN